MKKYVPKNLSFLFIILIGTFASAQMTGKVVDTYQLPIAYANVIVEGTTYGTSTDENGMFVLDYEPSATTALLISYVGFSDQRVLWSSADENGLTIILEENPFQLGAVQVTARRTEETIREVPQSVTVLSGLEIEKNAATGFQDVLNLVPNVLADESKAITTFSIRGIPSGTGGIGGVTPEGIYVNGVYNAKPELANSLVSDAQRVEVLRGPQGTSFGAASISGALNIVTPKPSANEFLSFGAEYGSREYLRLRTTFNAKVSDNLFARGNLLFLERDRPMINLNPAQEQAGERITAGRFDLRYQPKETITFDLGLDFADEDIAPDGLSVLSWENAIGTDVPSDVLISSIDPNVDITPTGRGNYRFNDEQVADRNLFGATLNADFQLSDRLNLLSISAFRTSDQFLTFDLDRTSLDHILEERDLQVQQLSQEIRLAGTSEKFDWTTGVFLMNVTSDFKADLKAGQFFEDFVREFGVKPAVVPIVQQSVIQGVEAQITAQVTDLVNNDPNLSGLTQEERDAVIAQLTQDQLASEPIQQLIANETQNAVNTTEIDLAGKAVKQRAEITENTIGIFASGEYQLTDNLKLSAGIRFNREEKDITIEQDGIQYDISVGGAVVLPNNPIFAAFPDEDGDFLADGPATGNFSEDVITANGSLNYAVSDNINTYISYARGYRSGGFGIRYVQNAREITEPFKSEKVDNYEFGIKAANKSNKLFANLAAFYMDYRDLQNTIILSDGSGQLITNAGSSRIYGVEFDFAAYATDNLAFSGGFGYNNARFVDYSFNNGFEEVDRSGDKISSVPPLNATLSADYFVPINDNNKLTFRLQYRYRGEVNLSDTAESQDNLDAFTIPAFGLLNGRIALQGKKLDVYVFSNNILDEAYNTSAFVNTVINTPFSFRTNSIGEPFFLGAGFVYRIGN